MAGNNTKRIQIGNMAIPEKLTKVIQKINQHKTALIAQPKVRKVKISGRGADIAKKDKRRRLGGPPDEVEAESLRAQMGSRKAVLMRQTVQSSIPEVCPIRRRLQAEGKAIYLYSTATRQSEVPWVKSRQIKAAKKNNKKRKHNFRNIKIIKTEL